MIHVFLLFSCAVSALCQDVKETVVVTKVGPISGVDRGDYSTYFGIPYALVDEENPFGESLPYPDFQAPFNATDSSIYCPQMNYTSTTPTPIGNLQCLILNIFVPKTTNKNIPVLVWIHGGGFVIGNGGDFDGRYLVKHDIIVVTINFRLGPYGFFCLETDDVPANQGLWDQVSALKWINKNIEAFGGDPNKVTIDGESYGGGSVELLLYSESEKLYDKAIIQSGGIDTEAIIVGPKKDAAYTLAKVFEPEVEKEKSLKVLAKQDPLEVIKAFHSSKMHLCPCMEKVIPEKNITKIFLSDHSFEFYAPHRVAGTPIMIGYNSKEGFDEYISMSDKEFQRDIFTEKIRNKFNLEGKLLTEAIDSVKKFYLGNKSLSRDAMFELMDFADDFMVNYPEERAVTRFLNQSAVVYKYLFSFTGNSDHKNVSGVGATHTEELQYLFYFGEELTPEDSIILTKDRMTAMWANFVKYGNPTPELTEILPVKWQQATLPNRSYLDIDKDLKMKDNVYQSRMEFWEAFWQKYAPYRKPYPSFETEI